MIIELTHEQTDAIVVEALLDSLSCLLTSYNRLIEKSNLTPGEQEDLTDDLYYISGIEVVLSNFMTVDDFQNKVGKKHPYFANKTDYSYMKEAVPELRDWEYDGHGIAVWKNTNIPYNQKKP
jgi:hypothetical protein